MNQRKKASKYRGSKTHGGGSMKKRRGAGNRGGRGRAGSGKKGDCKKPKYWKEQANKGFVGRIKNESTISIADINRKVAGLGTAKTTNHTLDLNKLGYHKLLGTGNTKLKLTITVDKASKSAIEKIEKAGGSIKLLKVKGTLKTAEAKKSEAEEPAPAEK